MYEQREFYFFLPNLCTFYFLFLSYCRLGLPRWCWKGVVRRNILPLFLILVGKLPVSYHLCIISSIIFYRCSLPSWGSSLLFLVCWEVFFFLCHEWVFHCVKYFRLIYWNGYVIFLPWLVHVMDYINWFSNVEPASHTLGESLLVMVYNSFYILLD